MPLQTSGFFFIFVVAAVGAFALLGVTLIMLLQSGQSCDYHDNDAD